MWEWGIAVEYLPILSYNVSHSIEGVHLFIKGNVVMFDINKINLNYACYFLQNFWRTG